jgi:hypothetical protein
MKYCRLSLHPTMSNGKWITFFCDMVEPSGAIVSELVGSIQFTTTGGRNGIASFGARSGAALINP